MLRRTNLLEIACFNSHDAVLASKHGADRIEFCADYSVGGLTPAETEVLFARAHIQIQLYVMIRARAGNFIYNSDEYNVMLQSVMFCKMNQIDGIVFGFLNDNMEVDMEHTKRFVSLARPMKTTFHRAFDEIKNPLFAIEKLIECGVDHILTSGGNKTASDGSSNLLNFVKAAGNQIEIIPGGNIRSSNIQALAEKTTAKTFHSAALNDKLKLDVKDIERMKQMLSE